MAAGGRYLARTGAAWPAEPRGFPLNVITTALAGVAGPAFILKAGGGLFRLIPAAMASLPGGVINAGLFLIKVAS